MCCISDAASPMSVEDNVLAEYNNLLMMERNYGVFGQHDEDSVDVFAESTL